MSLAHAPQLSAFETALRAHRLSSIMLSVCGGAVVLALAEGEETGSKVEEVVRVSQRACRRESCSTATLPAVVPRMSRECARSPATVARHARTVRHGENQHVASGGEGAHGGRSVICGLAARLGRGCVDIAARISFVLSGLRTVEDIAPSWTVCSWMERGAAQRVIQCDWTIWRTRLDVRDSLSVHAVVHTAGRRRCRCRAVALSLSLSRQR